MTITAMKKEYAVGVDLGGTKIVAGLVRRDGKIIGEPVKVLTRAEEPKEKIADRLIRSVKKALASADCKAGSISGIGIGSPGPLDIEKGIILTPPNLSSLHNYNIKQVLAGAFGLPVELNNDANCFALGESCFGAGKDCGVVFGVTLGTGLGSGIVIDRKIYNGATGTAAELWCCPCREGILEDYISGRGIERIYKTRTGPDAGPPAIAEKAKQGDRNAIESWQEFGEHLGEGLSYVVNILDPDIIVIGGSLSNAYELFVESLENSLKKHINPLPRQNLKIAKTALGGNAGLVGAACLAFTHLKI